jgi:hypothetical protein
MYDPGTLYVDPILTNFSVGYRDQTLYGLDILPETPVRTQSGKYRVYDRSNWVIFKARREPGTVANEVVGGKWSEDVFSTQEHSLQSPVLDEELQQLNSQGGLADPVFGGDLQLDPHRDATELVTRSLQLEHELKVSTLVRDAAQYDTANKVDITAAKDKWDYQASDYTGDPVAVIRKGLRQVYAVTGRWPNTLAIPTLGATYLETHPKIVDRYKNFALTQSDAFTQLTGFQGRILLVDSVYNAANNIDAAETITSFWGKDVWLGLVDPTPGQLTRTFGKTFAQIYPDGSTKPTDRWREEPRKADLVRTSWKYDLKIVSNDCGYLIQNAFATTAF